MDRNGSEALHTALIENWGLAIVSGEIETDARMTIDQAAVKFGVSRTVVREAVRVLESIGLLSARRRVGITVQPPESWSWLDANVLRWRLAGPHRLEHLESLTELRIVLEPLAARLAATRATPEQCGELQSAVIGMSVNARSADTDAYLAADTRFHETLLAASGNPMLSSLRGVVIGVLEGRTRHALMPSVASSEALQLHSVAAAAIQGGDPDAAEEAVRAIVDESRHGIMKLATPDTTD